MDKAQARLFAQQLVADGVLDGWRITEMLGHGKSAVVMKGEKSDSPPVAIKVFHPEIIERFGLEHQMERIRREQTLIGNDHPNAVQILGGGLSEQHKYPYIVMSFETGLILSSCLNSVPQEKYRHVIMQIASVARHLENVGYAHRDIKPDNIIVTDLDTCTIKLLDFGVLRPLGASSLTDGPGHTPFVGTHQYSPPEMLHRKEDPSAEGWRAISFYQIGAVIHDLIMKRPLFEDDKEPYANLVVAVDTKYPVFNRENEDKALVVLAKRCLLKNPAERLNLVQWEDFFLEHTTGVLSKEERLAYLTKLRKATLAEESYDPLERTEIARLARQRSTELTRTLRTVVELVLDNLAGGLPPRKISALDQVHPEPTLLCEFVKDRTLAFGERFSVEFSIFSEDESEVVAVYARVEKKDQPKTQWHGLGTYTRDLDGLHGATSEWMVGVLEEVLTA